MIVVVHSTSRRPLKTSLQPHPQPSLQVKAAAFEVSCTQEMWGTRKHSPFTSLEPRVLVDISFAVQPQSCCRSTIRRGGLELAGGSQSSLRHTRGRRRLLLRSKLLHWKVREREREPRLERLLTLRSTYERRRITQPPPKKGPNRRRRRPPQYCKHTLAKVALLGPDDSFFFPMF